MDVTAESLGQPQRWVLLWLRRALISLVSVLFACPGLALADVATRSTNISLNQDGSLLYVVNREANTVSIFQVYDNWLAKLDEVAVGQNPICVAVRGLKAFVTNGASGTVSVINATGGRFAVVDEIAVGVEPRGCALSQDGHVLYVANYTM